MASAIGASLSEYLLCVFFHLLQSPWCNRTGWQGIKHQLTYLLIYSSSAGKYLTFLVWFYWHKSEKFYNSVTVDTSQSRTHHWIVFITFWKKSVFLAYYKLRIILVLLVFYTLITSVLKIWQYTSFSIYIILVSIVCWQNVKLNHTGWLGIKNQSPDLLISCFVNRSKTLILDHPYRTCLNVSSCISWCRVS